MLHRLLVAGEELRQQNEELAATYQAVIAEHQRYQELSDYEFIANTAKEFMTFINRNYVYEAANESFRRAHNKPLSEIMGRTVADVWGEKRFKSVIKTHLDECFAGNEVHYQTWIKFATLGLRYIDVAYYPYNNDEGTVTHTVVVSRDITGQKRAEDALQKAYEESEIRVEKHTAQLSKINAHLRKQFAERKRAEESLRDSEERYRHLVELSFDAVVIHSEGKVVYVNVPGTKFFGAASPEELIGKPILDFIHPDYLEIVKARMQETAKNGTGVPLTEEKLIWPDGTSIDVEAAGVPVTYQGRPAIMVVIRDITQRRQAEEALVASEAHLLAEMQSVLIITHALVSEMNLNELLEFIMTQAEHLMNANGAAVFLMSDDGQQLKVATPSKSWLRIKPNSQIPVQGSLAGLAIASQRVQISNHALKDDRTASVRALLQSTEIHSLQWAPLIAQNENLGALLVWSENDHIFTAQDSRLIMLFADQAALALHNAHLHTQNRQLAIEQERHRLARALHDSVTQSFYSIGLAAQTTLRVLGQDADSTVREPVEHIYTLSQTALAEMRTHLHDLHPTVLAEKGLVKTLTQHCDILREEFSFAVEFIAGSEPPLSVHQQKELYYITREALWNVVKHARATQVSVSLTNENDQVVLSIVDNGVGFDSLVFTQLETMGLRSMKERAKLLGGALELQSKPEQGTRLIIRIPIQSY